MTKPIQLMIAGAPKAGTSSLLNYLAQHPQIHTHTHLRPEMTYFTNEEEFQLGYEQVYPRYFGEAVPAQRILLAKDALLMTRQIGVQRLHNHNPDAIVLVILRNPVERAYSGYWFNYRHGWEKLSFEEALLAEERRITPYVKHGWQVRQPDRGKLTAYKFRGIYDPSVEYLFEYFGRKQVVVLLLEDLKDDPAQIFQTIFQKSGIDATFVPNPQKRYNPAKAPRSKLVAGMIAWLFAPKNPIKKTATRYLPYSLTSKVGKTFFRINTKNERFTPPPMNPETRQMLIEYFRPHNERLSELIGRDLSHWNR